MLVVRSSYIRKPGHEMYLIITNIVSLAFRTLVYHVAVRIKRSKVKGKIQTKFKLRCSRPLYTLVLTDGEKADKLKQSLPPG